MTNTSSAIESKILWLNAKALGIDLLNYYLIFGKNSAEFLVKKYGKNKSYAVVCGLGGNGADGLAIAGMLDELEVKNVDAYLIGRPVSIENEVTKLIYKKLFEFSNVTIHYDSYAKDIEQPDVLIEALVGTGLEKEVLNKRYKDVVARFSHFNSKIVAVDVPCPHYSPDTTLSLMYPKVENAEVIAIDIPAELEKYCGPGEKEFLWKPKRISHKAKNGQIIYFSTDSKLNDVVNKSASSYETSAALFNFESSSEQKEVKAKALDSLIEESDSILLGDTEEDLISYATINHLISKYRNKTYVVFGESLSIVQMRSLSEVDNALIIIDRLDLQKYFQKEHSKVNQEGVLKRFAVEKKINLILVGTSTILINKNGETRMVKNPKVLENNYKAKLAATIASYSTKNDLWLSMRAGMS